MEDLYRIAWRDSDGETGHGKYCFTLHMATTWIRELYKTRPNMRYWIEKKCAIPN
jgi:hypothetical protein